MADIYLLRGDCMYAKNRCPISYASGSSNAPVVQLGTEMSAALELLMNAGFEIRYESADPVGFSYTLVRESTPPPGPNDYLESLLGEQITVETDAGAVSGILTFVGSDVIQLEEATGDTVLVPIAAIVAVY
jgi:ribosomal 30S subunit maturation factor RimM